MIQTGQSVGPYLVLVLVALWLGGLVLVGLGILTGVKATRQKDSAT